MLPQLVVSLVASLIFGVTSHHHQSPKANIPDTAQHASPSIGLELLFLCAECIAQDAKPTDSLLVSAACRQLMLHGWAFVAQSVHRVLFLMDEVLHAHSGSVLATPTFGHTPDANRARCHLHAPGAHKIK